MSIEEIQKRIDEINAERDAIWKLATKLLCPFKVGDAIRWTPRYGTREAITGTVKRVTLHSMNSNHCDWTVYVRCDGGRKHARLAEITAHHNPEKITALAKLRTPTAAQPQAE